MIKELKLDLACGNSKRDGCFGIDKEKLPGVDHVMDLQQFPWDIESESVEEIHCSNYLEHIPHNVNNPNDKRDGLIQFMDEAYRILKPGGKLFVQVPYGSSFRAYGDPTHERYLVDMSFYYYNKEWRESQKLTQMGINCNFDCIFSYYISNEMTLKSEEIRNKSFIHDWNAIDDLMVEMTKL